MISFFDLLNQNLLKSHKNVFQLKWKSEVKHWKMLYYIDIICNNILNINK